MTIAVDFTRRWTIGVCKGMESAGGTREIMVVIAVDARSAADLAKKRAVERALSPVGDQFKIVEPVAKVIGAVDRLKIPALVSVTTTSIF